MGSTVFFYMFKWWMIWNGLLIAFFNMEEFYKIEIITTRFYLAVGRHEKELHYSAFYSAERNMMFREAEFPSIIFESKVL